jgi:hypothetical protein
VGEKGEKRVRAFRVSVDNNGVSAELTAVIMTAVVADGGFPKIHWAQICAQ